MKVGGYTVLHEALMAGICAPLLTPFKENGEVDYDAFTNLCRYVTRGGITKLLVGGTTGEFVHLSVEERVKLLCTARSAVKSGCRIAFNITALDLHGMEQLAQAARRHADAAFATAPYYYRHDDAAQLAYFAAAAKLVQDLPFYLYHIPEMTHNSISPELAARLRGQCPNLAGIKDSSMDFLELQSFVRVLPGPGYEVMTGNDAQVLAALQAGGAGAIIATANLFPGVCCEIWDGFQSGQLETARRAQEAIFDVRRLVRSVMPIMGHKAVLEELGIGMGYARFPMRTLTGQERAAIRSGLQALKLA